MTVTLRSGQEATLIKVSGDFAQIQKVGQRGITIINKSFIRDYETLSAK